MNLRFLKSYHENNTRLIGENLILETEYRKSENEMVPHVRYFIYDLKANERKELLPKVRKLEVFQISDATYYASYVKYLYMVQYTQSDHEFHLIRYDIEDGNVSIMYSYQCTLEEMSRKKIHIFILNENNFIFQIERRNEQMSDENKHFLCFESYLYNVSEQKKYDIVDDNLVSNGIEEVIPLNDNHLIVKTGYNLLVDKRYENLTKEEVSVEAINIVNTAQFISDMMINQNGIVMEAVEQAYFTQTLPRIMVQKDYLIFSKLDLETKNEVTVFYNHIKKETYSCLSQNVTTIQKMSKPLLIDGIPYVRINRKQKTEFLNLISKKIDVTFTNERTLNKVVNSFFVVTEKKKAMFGKDKCYICLYKYPSMSLLHSENATYNGCLYDENTDTLYIYCK